MEFYLSDDQNSFEAYSCQEKESNVVASTEQLNNDVEPPSIKTDPWAAWNRQLSNNLQSKRCTELDSYLDEDPVPSCKELLGIDSSIKTDPWAAWNRQLSNNLQSKRCTELDSYLDEDPVPSCKEFDILKWWMGNESKYPILARIARDLLAIPASSVASESAFSCSERIISDFRSSLTPEIVEALICTQDWYRAEGSSEFNMSSINDFIMCEDNSSHLYCISPLDKQGKKDQFYVLATYGGSSSQRLCRYFTGPNI